MAIESIYFSLFIIFICTLCVVVLEKRIIFLFWLGLLDVNCLNYSRIFINLLKAPELYAHNMRYVPRLLFLGQHKSPYLNSITFGDLEYTYWSTIGNQKIKA